MKNCMIITYDIKNDKLRTKVSKYLMQHGTRLQFSVFEVVNSERMINNICEKIKQDFKPQFTQADSIIIFFTNLSKAITYGNAQHLDKDVVFIS